MFKRQEMNCALMRMLSGNSHDQVGMNTSGRTQRGERCTEKATIYLTCQLAMKPYLPMLI